MTEIKGFYYFKNYMSKEEISLIKDKIKNEIQFEPITNSKNSRRVAHFGYTYNYFSRDVETAEPIPDYLLNLVNPDRIPIQSTYNQVIINEYKPGQKIAPHVDHTKLFGPIIACITIGQSVNIKFELNELEENFKPREGSLYMMTNDSRYKWKHSLINNRNKTRYSITYRNVL